jgi:phosphoribosylanthranilate isomerase
MTHVKVCGFQSVEAAIVAAEAGADAIGLVFVPSARRCLALDDAKVLLSELREALPGERAPEIVGLFGDQPVDEVREYVETLGLDAVQLCGAEDVGYAKQLGVPVYKVISINPDVPISAQMPRIMVLQQRHAMAGHRIVIDTKVAGQFGGTGRTFDWELAADLAEGLDLCLEGGLTPDNVGEAVTRVKPWGVGTSSGVETDGTKDLGKVRAFVETAKGAGESAPRGLKKLLKRRSASGSAEESADRSQRVVGVGATEEPAPRGIKRFLRRPRR